LDPTKNGPLGNLWPDDEPKWFSVDQTHPFYDEIIQFIVSAISLQALIYPAILETNIRDGAENAIKTPSGAVLPVMFPNPRFETHFLEIGCDDECVISNAAVVDYLLGNIGMPDQIFFAIKKAPNELPNVSEFNGQLNSHIGPTIDNVTRYLIGGAFEKEKEYLKLKYGNVNQWPPELQFFRHLRNGCFHNNTFNFILL
jgi:hypothetical protein